MYSLQTRCIIAVALILLALFTPLRSILIETTLGCIALLASVFLLLFAPLFFSSLRSRAEWLAIIVEYEAIVQRLEQYRYDLIPNDQLRSILDQHTTVHSRLRLLGWEHGTISERSHLSELQQLVAKHLEGEAKQRDERFGDHSLPDSD